MKKIAVIGLGKMGMQIARRLLENGFDVIAYNRSKEPRDVFSSFGGVATDNFQEISDFFGKDTKTFLISLPADIVDGFLKSDFKDIVKKGDYIIDGGNCFYKDSVARAEYFSSIDVNFFDCGISGGVHGYKNGFALMLGGDSEKFSYIEGFVKTLSAGNNYGLVGAAGAGHFVKMVHNGIEYGMMEAIAEGYAVMDKSGLGLDLLQVTKIYQEGTVIRSWLIDLMRDIYEKENIENTVGFVNASGEGLWTVNTAKELGVDVRVIESSLQVRDESKNPSTHDDYRNKLLSLMRKSFGGHSVVSK